MHRDLFVLFIRPIRRQKVSFGIVCGKKTLLLAFVYQIPICMLSILGPSISLQEKRATEKEPKETAAKSTKATTG